MVWPLAILTLTGFRGSGSCRTATGRSKGEEGGVCTRLRSYRRAQPALQTRMCRECGQTDKRTCVASVLVLPIVAPVRGGHACQREGAEDEPRVSPECPTTQRKEGQA